MNAVYLSSVFILHLVEAAGGRIETLRNPLVFSPTSDPGTLLVTGKTKGLNSDGDRFNNHGVLLKFGYTVPTEGIFFR